MWRGHLRFKGNLDCGFHREAQSDGHSLDGGLEHLERIGDGLGEGKHEDHHRVEFEGGDPTYQRKVYARPSSRADGVGDQGEDEGWWGDQDNTLFQRRQRRC